MGKIKFKNVTKIELTEEQYEILSDAITIMGEIVDGACSDIRIPVETWSGICDSATKVKQSITNFMNTYCEGQNNE